MNLRDLCVSVVILTPEKRCLPVGGEGTTEAQSSALEHKESSEK